MIDLRRLERILATVPSPADREWLCELLEPRWRRRERRITERDDLIREVAAQFYSFSSGRVLANSIRKDLLRVARLPQSTSGQPDAHHEALRRLVELSGGRVLSVSTLRNALAGLLPSGGQNSSADFGHPICDKSIVESHSEESANGSCKQREANQP